MLFNAQHALGSQHTSRLSILYPHPKASQEKPAQNSWSTTTVSDTLVIASSCPSCTISFSLLPPPLRTDLGDTSKQKAINHYTGLNQSHILCLDPSQMSLLVRCSLAILSKIATPCNSLFPFPILFKLPVSITTTCPPHHCHHQIISPTGQESVLFCSLHFTSA